MTTAEEGLAVTYALAARAIAEEERQGRCLEQPPSACIDRRREPTRR